MEINHDELPELGTKAAAVAAIESLIYRAIGAKDLEPLQLRYWLDAYYQARTAAGGVVQGVVEMRKAPQPAAPLPIMLDGNEKWSDDGVIRWYYVKPLREDPVVDENPGYNVILRRTEDGGLEFERVDETGGPMRASAPTEGDAEIQVDQFGYETPGAESGPEDAAETQQKTEPAAKSQRMRPVGWSDGFEPVEAKRSGAAEAAAFKREQFERLQRFLREGVTMQRIVKAADGNITEDQILGIRECRRVPVAVYRVLEAALDRIETD